MLLRKITSALLQWKNKEKKKCLLVQGARQVGKTFSIHAFGKISYKEVLEINLKESRQDQLIFSGNLDVDTLIQAIRFRYPHLKLIPGETLIFLDEIQECPEAITSLKFWTLDGRYDVIASGSLLGVDANRSSSYPVGYVEYLRMTGLDFEEYLCAKGIEADLIQELKNQYHGADRVPEAIHSTMMEYVREYLSIGGMPEVVASYIDHRDFRMADQIQRETLTGYQYDIAHYAQSEEKVKAEKCYLSLGRQLLAKENHKFQYKEVERGGRAQKFYSSMDWLVTADLIAMAKRVTDLTYDLTDYARDDFFRAYTTDLSLLIAMRDFGLKQHIMENTLLANTKGGLYECLIADFLIKKGLPLFFYKNETTKREIDFLTQREGEVLAIEVKSGRGRARSLQHLMEDKKVSQAVLFHDGNVGEEDGIRFYPIYMAMFL